LRELTAAPRAALNDTNRLSQLARDLLLLARSADDDTYIDARAEGVDRVLAAVPLRAPGGTRDEMTPG
jgi:hypothetical protein